MGPSDNLENWDKPLEQAHLYQRNEKLARRMEIEFDHELTKGRHNRAVMHAFKNEGVEAHADRMVELTGR